MVCWKNCLSPTARCRPVLCRGAAARISDIGRLNVVLVDSTEAPTGAGETAMVAGAGAIANALRDATGHRFSRVPVRPADVLQALRR